MRTPPTYSCDAPHAPGTPPNSPPAALHKKSCLHKKSVMSVLQYPEVIRSGIESLRILERQATDSTNKRGDLHVDVIVQNVDGPPAITGPDTVDHFPENSPTTRQVGRYTTTDPEGATVTMSLTVGAADFSLAGNGVLTFKESPDYEEQSSYIATVRAEAGSHTVDKMVTVNIQNVEEPGSVSLSTVQPQEGASITATLEDDDIPTGTTWQWRRTSSRGSAGTAIANADSRSYTPDAADVGSYVRDGQDRCRRQRQPGAGGSTGPGVARVPRGRRL